MLIRTVDINELHESEFNPRIKLEKTSKEYQQIAASIQEFGFVEPLVVNEHNMCVIGGHQRLQVLKDSGATEVECVMINETDPEREKRRCAWHSTRLKETGIWKNWHFFWEMMMYQYFLPDLTRAR